jgi:hypothetical protein
MQAEGEMLQRHKAIRCLDLILSNALPSHNELQQTQYDNFLQFLTLRCEKDKIIGDFAAVLKCAFWVVFPAKEDRIDDLKLLKQGAKPTMDLTHVIKIVNKHVKVQEVLIFYCSQLYSSCPSVWV